jgi:putative endonuclease
MKESTRDKGNKGEDIAVEYLTNKAYKIKKRNFHFGKVSELDIVAEDGDVLVFIEVKTRNSNEFGDPIQSITPQKQKKLRSAATGYLYINKIEDKECRFDVIIVDLRNKNPQIEHLINAM